MQVMQVIRRCLPMLLALGGMLLPLDASAQVNPQTRQTRQGFWINFGLGYGTLGCVDCSDREGGLSGGLALGGTLGERWLLGVGTTGWTKSEEGATLTASTITATARFYPALGSGFFLLGGLGLGSLDARFDYQGFAVSAGRTGAGAVLGLGWDLRVGDNVSLTPFWNGYAIALDGGDANVGQLGIGLTVH